MMEFKNRKLVKIQESNLKENEILERYDLQESIKNSWADFTNEINMPQLLFIGQEICPHSSVQNSIDILAFDPIDGKPVIFELKRDKNKLQLLQAISYASMVATWSKSKLLEEAKGSHQLEDLEDEIEDEVEFKSKVKIILIAERFDPEVMITCDWLYTNFNLDVTTFSLNVYNRNNEIFFNFSQTFPLPELKDAYELRTRRKLIQSETRSWDEIRKNFKYEWGNSILDTFLKFSPGDTTRKRFPPLIAFRGIIPFDKIAASFRERWVLIYLWGKPEGAKDILIDAFGKDNDIGEWRDGWSIKIQNKHEADKLLKWLHVKNPSKAA